MWASGPLALSPPRWAGLPWLPRDGLPAASRRHAASSLGCCGQGGLTLAAEPSGTLDPLSLTAHTRASMHAKACNFCRVSIGTYIRGVLQAGLRCGGPLWGGRGRDDRWRRGCVGTCLISAFVPCSATRRCWLQQAACLPPLPPLPPSWLSEAG